MDDNALLTYEKVKNVTIIFKDGSKHRIENVRVDVYANFITIKYLTTNRKVRVTPFTNIINIILEVDEK